MECTDNWNYNLEMVPELQRILFSDGRDIYYGYFDTHIGWYSLSTDKIIRYDKVVAWLNIPEVPTKEGRSIPKDSFMEVKETCRAQLNCDGCPYVVNFQGRNKCRFVGMPYQWVDGPSIF